MSTTWNIVTKLTDQVIETFNEMHRKDNIRYMVLGFDNERTQIELKAMGRYGEDDDNAEHQDFVNALPDNDVAYGVINLRYAMQDGGQRSRLFFVCWVPDSLRRETLRATAQAKAIGVMNSSVLKRSFKVGMTATVQANHVDDVALPTLLERAQRREMCTIDMDKSLNQL